MIVYAVKYSNYEPAEVASLWIKQESADRERDRLNEEDRAKGHSGMWEVAPMTVNDE